MKRKILILHNSYRQPGGEDAVVQAESNLLRGAGHDVTVELVSNEAISSALTKASVFVNTPHNFGRKEWTKTLLRQTGAEILHVHNFFPLLSPAVHEAACESGVAVVQTLHNFRTLCASALLLRNGAICEKCLVGPKLWGVWHRCYRGSLPGSIAVVRMQQRAQRHQTWQRSVHRLIALTDFAAAKFGEGGMPLAKIVVKPNFVDDRRHEGATRRGALFVGRLSPEKGLATLLEAWRKLPEIPLSIVGDGPERPRLQALAAPNVTFLGSLRPDQVRSRMSAAACLIMPSIWYEGFPLTLVESFSAGTPVVASRLGSLAELVENEVTGLAFEPGNTEDLVRAVRQAFASPATLSAMGEAARKTYEAKYTPKVNLAQLEDIYSQALTEARFSSVTSA